MRDAFVETLLEEATKNQEIILITGDLGFGVLEKFQKQLPKQFINSGVNEQTMMGMAAGMASTGKRVFVYSIGNFSTLRCLEQIRNDVCLMNNSVVIISVGAGYAYGAQGYTHHALEDLAAMRVMPNLEVISPADDFETRIITKLLCRIKTPAYFRLGRSKATDIHNSIPNIDFGKMVEIYPGNKATILFTGSVGRLAIEARNQLLAHGIDVAVASMPFITSTDAQYLSKIAKKGPIVTVEDHSNRGGLCGSVLETLSSLRIIARVGCVASKQLNLSLVGDESYLRENNGISTSNIVNEIIALLEA